MARVFEITAASENVLLDAKGAGEIAFTASNVSGKPLSGKAMLIHQDPAVKPWLTLGDAVRNFPAGGTQQYTVKVVVPPGTKPGKYNFRLDLASVQNPDEDYAQGPNVAVAVPLVPEVNHFKWWWLVVAAVVVLAIGGVAIYLLTKGGGSIPVPDLAGKTVAEATALLTQNHLKVGDIENVVTDTAKVDTVLRQDPKPPAKVASDSAVNLGVGVALVSIPPLKNRPYTEVVKLLQDNKLDIGKVTNVNQVGIQTPGLVLDSSPKEGNTVKSHQTVDLTVQQATVNVPNVIGQPYAVALGRIANANLKVGSITGNFYQQVGTAMVPIATVVDQSPKPGEAPVGSAVSLTFPGGPVRFDPRVFQSIQLETIRPLRPITPIK
jgi:beta-lactam-binding protein with PASTA domain